MSLTSGTGPFGTQPAGRFNFDVRRPESIIYFEDSPRRVRVELGGQTVADSGAMKLLHETGHLPRYFFPKRDVQTELLKPSGETAASPPKGVAHYFDVLVGERVAANAAWHFPEPAAGELDLEKYLTFSWRAMDAWYEEDEEVFVHARDPYHRVDVRRCDRLVRIRVDDELIAESRRARVLFETGLPPRYYLPPKDVRRELLQPSDHRTRCAYKGEAVYFSIVTASDELQNVAWSLPNPLYEATDVKEMLSFFSERIRVEVEGAGV